MSTLPTRGGFLIRVGSGLVAALTVVVGMSQIVHWVASW